MPSAPGDHPESVQFTVGDGAQTSLPVARRTLIPADGGSFQTQITSSVGTAELQAANPAGGIWQIDVELNLTVSGKEFTQTVYGNLTDGGAP